MAYSLIFVVMNIHNTNPRANYFSLLFWKTLISKP